MGKSINQAPGRIRRAVTLICLLFTGFGPIGTAPPAVDAAPLSVPVIMQQLPEAEKVRGLDDYGVYNCLPASMAMVLQYLLPGEMSDEERYRSIRQPLRQTAQHVRGLNFDSARISEFTNGAISAHNVTVGPGAWEEMVERELFANYPIIAYIANAPLMEPAIRNSKAHAVVITGYEDGKITYNDPWGFPQQVNGKTEDVATSHEMSVDSFLAAWVLSNGDFLAMLFRRAGDTLPTNPQTPVPVTPVPTTSPTTPPIRTPIPPVPTTAPVAVPTIAPRQDPDVQLPELTVDDVIAGVLRAMENAGTYRYEVFDAGSLYPTVEVDLINHRSRAISSGGEQSWVCVEGISYIGDLTMRESLPCDQTAQNPYFGLIGQWLADPSIPWTLQPQVFMSGRVAHLLEWLTFDGDPPMVRQLWVDSQTFLPLRAFVRQPVERDYIEWEFEFYGWGESLDIRPPDSGAIYLPESENGSNGQPGMGHVSFLALRCPTNEGLVIADPTFFDIGIDCLGISEKTFSLLIIDEAGNESTVEFSGSTELTLPYGVYEIINPATGDRGTLSLIPKELYEEYCAGAEVCTPTWQVVIRSSLDDQETNKVTFSDMATVHVSALECTVYDPGIYAFGPTQNNPTPDLENCRVRDELVTLHLVDQDGNEQFVDIQGLGESSFELPFGTYDVSIAGTDLSTTLFIEHDLQYDAACGNTADCPFYWLIEYNLPPTDTELNGPDSTVGSVTVSLYQCPGGVSAHMAGPSTCQAGATGSLELDFWNYESLQSMTLADASWNGESYSWTGLSYGTYVLKPAWGVDGSVSTIYVPGLESFDNGSATVDWDDTTYPATPDYTVSPLSGTGYWVPVTADQGDLTLEVYIFGPECSEESCESGEAITTVQSSSSVEDPLIAEAIERFGGEWTGTFYQSNPTREWPIRITYWGGPEGTVVGSIEYLPEVCTADLIQLQMVLDFGLSLQEEVTSGQENCLSGGTINLDGNSSGLTFTWGHPDSDATGHGTLQKVGSAQPVETGTGGLEIHAVTCPSAYSGTDFYNACHSNGEVRAEFIVDGGGMTLPMTTQIDPATGAGVAGLDALTPDNYYVLKYTEGPGVPAFVFCSPDQGATTLVSQYIAGNEGLTVPVINGQTVVCDWYSLP